MRELYAQLYDPAASDFTLPGADLTEAFNVCIKQRINAAWEITFDMTYNGTQWQHVVPGAVVKADGQLYIIEMVKHGLTDGLHNCHAMGIQLFWARTTKKHVPKIDKVGATASAILEFAYADTGYRGNAFRQLTSDEVIALGMTPVTTATDIKVSKRNPWEITSQVIQQVSGEFYVDNFTFALVEQLGTTTDMVFSPDVNLESYEATHEETNMVTRLYPYGANNLEIDSVNGGLDYIDSDKYDEGNGLEGHIDLTQYKDKATLLTRAQMEFAPDNYYRIDRPKISYQISTVDLWKLAAIGEIPESNLTARLNLGDYARVVDSAIDFSSVVRVVEQTIYPYEPTPSVITLGDPPKTVLDIVADVVSGNSYFNNINIYNPLTDFDLGALKDEIIAEVEKDIGGGEAGGGKSSFDTWVFPNDVVEDNVSARDVTKPRPADGIRIFTRMAGGSIKTIRAVLAEDVDDGVVTSGDTESAYDELLTPRGEVMYWTEIENHDFTFVIPSEDGDGEEAVTWPVINDPPFTRTTVINPTESKEIDFPPGITPAQKTEITEQVRRRYAVRLRKHLSETVLDTKEVRGDGMSYWTVGVPALDADGNPVVGEDGGPVYAVEEIGARINPITRALEAAKPDTGEYLPVLLEGDAIPVKGNGDTSAGGNAYFMADVVLDHEINTVDVAAFPTDRDTLIIIEYDPEDSDSEVIPVEVAGA